MVKYARKSCLEHVLCINHCLHLSVLRTIGYFLSEENIDNKKSNLIIEIRKIVHSFKKSPFLEENLKAKLKKLNISTGEYNLKMGVRPDGIVYLIC